MTAQVLSGSMDRIPQQSASDSLQDFLQNYEDCHFTLCGGGAVEKLRINECDVKAARSMRPCRHGG